MRTTLLHLSLLEGVGPVAIQKIVQTAGKGTDLSILYEYTIGNFIERCGLSERLARTLATGLANKAVLEKEIEQLEKNAISWTTLADSDYPQLLATIYAPPSVLYWQGLSPDHYSNALAIVGSRNASLYAHTIINGVVEASVAHGITIVSGGALGADGMAHQATINANGLTVAVLGSGLLQPYPLQHKKLFNDIIASGGTLLSIFPSAMTALPGNFPARNRVIAGLARATLVVQAAQKSGALITARYALDQGRDVLAVPGRIDDELSVGCNELIKQGAAMVTAAYDVLDLFGIARTALPQAVVAKTPSHHKIIPKPNPSLLEPQQKIIALCVQPYSFDDLLSSSEFSFQELQTILLELQLANLIEQDMSGRWVAL